MTTALMAGISGAGLLLCYHWFRAYADGEAGTMRSEYPWLVRLFTVEVVLLIGTTLVTVAATAWSAWNTQRSASRSEDAGVKIDTAARRWLAPNWGVEGQPAPAIEPAATTPAATEPAATTPAATT